MTSQAWITLAGVVLSALIQGFLGAYYYGKVVATLAGNIEATKNVQQDVDRHETILREHHGRLATVETIVSRHHGK